LEEADLSEAVHLPFDEFEPGELACQIALKRGSDSISLQMSCDLALVSRRNQRNAAWRQAGAVGRLAHVDFGLQLLVILIRQ
jgi:hypothetical protein